jgi:glutaminase
LEASGREVYDEILAARGSIAGPFRVWFHSPEFTRRATQLGEFLRYHTSLPPRRGEQQRQSVDPYLHTESGVFWNLCFLPHTTGEPATKNWARRLCPDTFTFLKCRGYRGSQPSARPDRLSQVAVYLRRLSGFAGRDLTLNSDVCQSEADANQRNQSIASLLQSYQRIYFDPLQATDIYTKQCSLNVNAKDLAAMAATLANGGVNPLTQKRIIDTVHCQHVLAVMVTAGLYENSGD